MGTAAVFFDVDFTLIHPGPRFQASGYFETCVRHGLTVDSDWRVDNNPAWLINTSSD